MSDSSQQPPWKPDDSIFEKAEGQKERSSVLRVKNALKEAGLDGDNEIITSRHPKALNLREKLRREGVLPPEFDQWQLPVTLKTGNLMVMLTVGHPNAKLPTHNHPNDAAFRVVAQGSLFYEGQELTVCDWMYVPKGMTYTYTVGPLGVVTICVYH